MQETSAAITHHQLEQVFKTLISYSRAETVRESPQYLFPSECRSATA